MELLFLIFTEIAKLDTRGMFCNHQIVKLNIRKMYFYSNHEIRYAEISYLEGDSYNIYGNNIF